MTTMFEDAMAKGEQDFSWRLVAVGALALVIVGLGISALPGDFLKFIGVMFYVTAVLWVGMGCYMFVRAELAREPRRFHWAVYPLFVLVPWMGGLAFFWRGASLARFSVSGTGVLWYLVFAAIVGFIAWAVTAGSLSEGRLSKGTRSLAYLVATGLVFCLSALTRSGQNLSSGDEDYYEESTPSTPQENRDRALFNYLVYSTACAIGISGALVTGRQD